MKKVEWVAKLAVKNSRCKQLKRLRRLQSSKASKKIKKYSGKAVYKWLQSKGDGSMYLCS